jgi:hypothetical protein
VPVDLKKMNEAVISGAKREPKKESKGQNPDPLFWPLSTICTRIKSVENQSTIVTINEECWEAILSTQNGWKGK